MKPWTFGPTELLEHARSHLGGKTAFDYRIAMISIDNAVELAIRTYLGLPMRIRGSDGPPRKDLQAAIGFSDLLDLLEKTAVRGSSPGQETHASLHVYEGDWVTPKNQEFEILTCKF